MNSSILYFDGIYEFSQVLDSHEESKSVLKRHVLVRLTAVVQAALILVRTVVVQTLRGLTNIVGGIGALEGKRILNGFKDLVSVVVQAVVLPLLAIVACLLPRLAVGFGGIAVGLVEDQDLREEAGKVREEQGGRVLEACRFVTAVPAGVVRGVTCTAQGVLLFDISMVIAGVTDFGIGIASPVLYFVGEASGWHHYSHRVEVMK